MPSAVLLANGSAACCGIAFREASVAGTAGRDCFDGTAGTESGGSVATLDAAPSGGRADRDGHHRGGDPVFGPDFLSWLRRNGTFEGITMRAIPEGRVVHPNVPQTAYFIDVFYGLIFAATWLVRARSEDEEAEESSG